jgi:hypothetical protein
MITNQDGKYKIAAKWMTRMPDQPVVVDVHHSKDGDTRGLLISFGTPDEGPKRLCAVAEWYGETKSNEIDEKHKKLISHVRMDRYAIWHAALQPL